MFFSPCTRAHCLEHDGPPVDENVTAHKKCGKMWKNVEKCR
jgi:hypothetical protein